MTSLRANGAGGTRSLAQGAFAAALLAVALLSLAQLFHRELTVFRDDYTHVDEIFFAVCATRGLSLGDPAVAGCHDNKAPIIYSFYQLVELASGRYSLTGIKSASVILVIAVLASVAALARRVSGGWVAAFLAAALAGQALAIDPELLALKTELVGTLFVLAGAALLLRWQRLRRPAWLFAAGAAFGLAVMTKQTFAFGAFAAGLWVLMSAKAARHGWISIVGDGLIFIAATAVPLGVLTGLFWARGELSDFAGSVFLHALAYGAGGMPPSLSEKAWKAGWLVHHFGLVFPISLLFAATLFQWLASNARRAVEMPAEQRALGLFLGLAVAMALVPVVAKQYFQPHLIPAWMLMSIAAAVGVAGWRRPQDQIPASGTGSDAAVVGVGLCVAGLMAGNSWYLNGDAAKRRLAQQHQLEPVSRIAGASGTYGYVLGVRPEFYFFNGIIPASDVLYPAALAGAGRVAASGHAAPATPMIRAHAAMLARAEERLMLQFEQTPPQHIFIVDKWARVPSSTKVTDVGVLDKYIAEHCRRLRAVDGKPYQAGVLFACNRLRAG